MEAPDEARTIEILTGIKDRYEAFHDVAYTPEAIEAAVYQSSRYITDRFLPDKAIDLVDEAGARAKLRHAAPASAARASPCRCATSRARSSTGSRAPARGTAAPAIGGPRR